MTSISSEEFDRKYVAAQTSQQSTEVVLSEKGLGLTADCWGRLPFNVVRASLQYIPKYKLAAYSGVCRGWNTMINQDVMWRESALMLPGHRETTPGTLKAFVVSDLKETLKQSREFTNEVSKCFKDVIAAGRNPFADLDRNVKDYFPHFRYDHSAKDALNYALGNFKSKKIKKDRGKQRLIVKVVDSLLKDSSLNLRIDEKCKFVINLISHKTTEEMLTAFKCMDFVLELGNPRALREKVMQVMQAWPQSF